jgi:hypothetical protein
VSIVEGIWAIVRSLAKEPDADPLESIVPENVNAFHESSVENGELHTSRETDYLEKNKEPHPAFSLKSAPRKGIGGVAYPVQRRGAGSNPVNAPIVADCLMVNACQHTSRIGPRPASTTP